MVRSLLRNRFLASCWVIEEPPWTTPPARALVSDGAERAGEVDAEMLVEAPVLGGEHRLDQVIGQLVERDRMVVLDAAAADLVAVAVEEGDRELGLLQPVLVGGLAERRDRRAPASARGRRGPWWPISESGSTTSQRRHPATWKRSMKVEKRS